jgi:hypothetical protein
VGGLHGAPGLGAVAPLSHSGRRRRARRGRGCARSDDTARTEPPTTSPAATTTQDTGTYTGDISDAGGIVTAATIAPVEAMHAAILHFVLGEYPVPLSFIPVDGAIEPAALTV